ncbi:hypothetical protein [Roseateles sp. L2-2]|uniref:hypothetical protein n=1 Tax=Roseateles TaxID=93681 RepID=UPI003D36402B
MSPLTSTASTQTDPLWGYSAQDADVPGTGFAAVDLLVREWLPRLNKVASGQLEAQVAAMEYFQSGKETALEAVAARQAEPEADRRASEPLPSLAQAAITRGAEVKYLVVVRSPMELELEWSTQFTKGIQSLPSERVQRMVEPQGSAPEDSIDWGRLLLRRSVTDLSPGQALFMTTPSFDALTVAKQANGDLLVVASYPPMSGNLAVLQGGYAQNRLDYAINSKGSHMFAMLMPGTRTA